MTAQMRRARAVGLSAAVLVGTAVVGVNAGVAAGAVGPGWAQITAVSVQDTTPTSAVLRVDFSRGEATGACVVNVWGNVDAVSPGGRRTETPHTKVTDRGTRSITYSVDGLAPNSRYQFGATVRITGFGGDFAPCRDVSQHATGPQEFTTPPDPAKNLAVADVAVNNGVTRFTVAATPSPHGRSEVWVEYGATTSYGTIMKPVTCQPSSCTGSFEVPPDPTVLHPNGTYHVRAVLENQFSGRQVSADSAFTAPNVCALAPRARANFTDCTLGAVDWSRKDGEPVDSSVHWNDIVLNGAKMQGAKLRYRQMYKAQMVKTDLTGADLDNAGLEGANLQGAILTGANLVWVSFQGADLRGADLAGADLHYANLTHAKLPPSIAEAKCSNFTTWPNGYQDHGTRCPPPTP
ncbi:MAG TPA: pentapeptide repeat-containing protein [Acidimicrobiales bacterium]|jgi:hypothetical protein|nr:pentapeptide repeat-containing protein [Acidimicrobiales bacterium]